MALEDGKFNKNKSQGFQQVTLPQNYLEGGYFDFIEQNGKKVPKLKKTLVLDTASEIAKSFGKVKPSLKKTQLRKFYDYSVNMLEKLRLCNNYDLIETDVFKLVQFAADARSRDNIPKIFYDFIEKNIKNIKNENDFKKGFIEHFQAVVAYFSFYNPRA